jgi:hypothetical protein
MNSLNTKTTTTSEVGNPGPVQSVPIKTNVVASNHAHGVLDATL